MATTKNVLVGKRVYDKKSGNFATVIREDGMSLVIQFDAAEGEEPVVKTITPQTLKRWYNVVEDGENKGEEPSSTEGAAAPAEEAPAEEAAGEQSTEGAAEPPKGEEKPKAKRGGKKKEEDVGPGRGQELTNMFLDTVKLKANQDIEICKVKDPRQTVVKYNGRNVFEMTTARKHLIVMCHPESLTPENKKAAEKEYPASFGWPLRTKFVFTDESQKPLMASIITDGLYYRQIQIDKAKQEAEEKAAKKKAREEAAAKKKAEEKAKAEAAAAQDGDNAGTEEPTQAEA